ncbi:hypothetical protein RND71_019360 [Anisodus tanguticus]|uniref:Uncharacterized protein n=1 Tax=Anisodus tanguticus TaxID=243964 RepID=A0AAE1S0D8_9SOLA|nr:hypothetical protein RND71_019360 [Anisodus tanguticus]
MGREGVKWVMEELRICVKDSIPSDETGFGLRVFGKGTSQKNMRMLVGLISDRSLVVIIRSSRINKLLNLLPHGTINNMQIGETHNHTQKSTYVEAIGVKIGNRENLKVRRPPRAHEVINGKPVVVFTRKRL